MKNPSRADRLMPGGIPRWIHVYDNGGESADRYTVVYTGRYRKQTGSDFLYTGMSGQPYHPQGVCLTGESPRQIDYPRYSHLGKRIKFTDLPTDCQKVVMDDYRTIWAL